MTESDDCRWPPRPGQIARDLAGLLEALERMRYHAPDFTEDAVCAAISIAQVYARELACFFTDQAFTDERLLDALELRWMERRRKPDE